MIYKYNLPIRDTLWTLFFISFLTTFLHSIGESYYIYQTSIEKQHIESLGACGNSITGPLIFILEFNVPICLASSTLLLLNSIFINKQAQVLACTNALCLSAYMLASTFNKLYEYSVRLEGEPVISSIWWWFFDSIAT